MQVEPGKPPKPFASSRRLTHFDTGHSGTPRWSPDGRWIAFDRQLDEGWRIFVMASDGDSFAD
ncbi:MAG: PD40 domain-containing protein [Acidobacteriaceae bacterium]|nr:PD40 domain-containing protein [Acidobacteriaceae bacterium]